jgi:hypothetical protein
MRESALRAALVVMLVGLAGCSSTAPRQRLQEVKVWHVVVIRLKEPGDERVGGS